MRIFGKSISLIMVLAILITISTAATVLYLSNDAKTSVTVESPIVVELSKNGVDFTTDDITLDPRYGGETSEFWVRYTNNAERDIFNDIETVISCTPPNGEYPTIGHADFDLFSPYSWVPSTENGMSFSGRIAGPVWNNGGGGNGACNKEPYVTYNNITDVLEINFNEMYNLQGWLPKLPAYHNVTIHVTLNHAQSAIGDYTITTQVMDDYKKKPAP